MAQAQPIPQITVTLPPRLSAWLLSHCADTGDEPAAVVIDIVALHLDALERIEDERPEVVAVPFMGEIS